MQTEPPDTRNDEDTVFTTRRLRASTKATRRSKRAASSGRSARALRQVIRPASWPSSKAEAENSAGMTRGGGDNIF